VTPYSWAFTGLFLYVNCKFSGMHVTSELCIFEPSPWQDYEWNSCKQLLSYRFIGKSDGDNFISWRLLDGPSGELFHSWLHCDGTWSSLTHKFRLQWHLEKNENELFWTHLSHRNHRRIDNWCSDHKISLLPCWPHFIDSFERKINTLFCFSPFSYLYQPIHVLIIFFLSRKMNFIIDR
jgi:hypothetical protein